MKKVIFAAALLFALVVASSYNVRVEINKNTAQAACGTSDC